jgi:phosphoribosylamine--glycine ligase
VTALRVLVVGSGGREHALAWRLARDPEVSEVLVAPGNDGMARSFRCLPAGELEGDALAALCKTERVDLAVIGPDAALAAGITDQLEAAGTPVYGPTKSAAQLEWSKWFAKEVMAEAGVPTARAARFLTLDEARRALPRFHSPWVIKADGLAAGKGVTVTSEKSEAEAFLVACFEAGRFGESGRTVLIEEFLEGEELSLTAVCDGQNYVLLPSARDYKRALEGDRGPNTGGMGTYAPAANREVVEETGRRSVAPLLAAMGRRGTPYRGTMYAGLMRTAQGIKVLEINARFGDPEAQAMLPLIEGSFVRVLLSAARGALDPKAIRISQEHAVAVALVDQGYPNAVHGGGTLAGLDRVADEHKIVVFHAGTKWEDGEWHIRGGRAAYIVATAASREVAREKAYAAVADIGGEGWRCRRDIAADGSMSAVVRPA